jgi:hypothetical protein
MNLPFPTDPTTRDATLLKDARLLNAYAEGAETGPRIVKRSGTILSNADLSAPGTPGQGLFYFGGLVYTINNDVLCSYTPSSGGGTTPGWEQL